MNILIHYIIAIKLNNKYIISKEIVVFRVGIFATFIANMLATGHLIQHAHIKLFFLSIVIREYAEVSFS